MKAFVLFPLAGALVLAGCSPKNDGPQSMVLDSPEPALVQLTP